MEQVGYHAGRGRKDESFGSRGRGWGRASNSKKKKKPQRDPRQKPAAEYSQPPTPAPPAPAPMPSWVPSSGGTPPHLQEKHELEQKEEETEKENGEIIEIDYSSDDVQAVNNEPEQYLEQFKSSSGKMSYSREHMMSLREVQSAMTKPPNLPVLACVLDSPVPQNSQSPMVSAPRGGGNNFRDSMQQDPLMPNFMENKFKMNMGPRHGGMNFRGGPQKNNYQPVIHLSLNKPVELNKSENAWVPVHKKDKDSDDTSDAQVLYKKARGILNKITPQKFDSLVDQFNDLSINTQELLTGVIDLVFDKAVEEPNYCHLYAKLCHLLAKKDVPSSTNETATKSGTVNFRKLLLTKCQKEYEKDKLESLDKESWEKKIADETEAKKKEEIRVEMEEAEQKVRRRYLGNVRFIGELYKAGLLSVKVIHECIQKMLREWDEDRLECLCKLMVTIGGCLEKDKANDGKIDQYFRMIKDIEEKKLSSRVKFMLQDLRDMRDNNWKPRREVAGPKKISQVHEDMQKEALQQTIINQNYTPTHGGRNDKPDRRGDIGRKGGYNQSNADDWNTVGNKRSKQPAQYQNERIDMNKLPVNKAVSSNDIKLGPGAGMANWGKGSQGGRNQESVSSNANRFSALSMASVPEIPQQRWGRGSGSRSGSQTKENAKPDRRYGSMKSSYSQERRRGEDAPRQNLGPRDGRGSAASSRESSMSREREVVSLLKGASSLDDDAARKAAELYTDEYIQTSQTADMLSSVADKFSNATIHMFVTNCVFHMLEKSPKDRALGGAMLEVLMSNRYLSEKQLQVGMDEVMKIAEDLIIDIPKLFEYICEILEPLLNSTNKNSRITIAFFRDAGTSCIQSGYGSRMLVGILRVLSDKSGMKTAAEIWSKSDCKLSDFIGDEDEKKFIQDHKFDSIFGEAPQPPEDLSQSITAILRLNKDHSEIETLLKKAKDTTNRNQVVRALTTAILNFCAVAGASEGSMSLSEERFIELNKNLLIKEIGQETELEVECLLSVQQFMDLMGHPQGLALKIFEVLYDKNVVSEDGFMKWFKSSEEAVGKGGVVQATKQFFTWLETAPEEDSNEER